MIQIEKSNVILIAEDDDADYSLFEDACKDATITEYCKLERVTDGNQLLIHLNKGIISKEKNPRLIILDLNMPSKGGKEALEEIKSTENFKDIPIIVLTTSSAEEDKKFCYDLGVKLFLSKPERFEDFIDIVKNIENGFLN